MSEKILAELVPTGSLRVGINLGNMLLVSGRSPTGEPEGVAPDVGREIAKRLGVPVKYVCFDRPGALADAADTNMWDIGLIGAEPARAEKIAFTAAYAEIEATYLVPPGSDLNDIGDVDQPGVRISVSARSAYDLWLQRNIRKAQIVQAKDVDASFEEFVAKNMEALAGLRSRLVLDVEKMPGSRILKGNFTTVQQAVGTSTKNAAGAVFLSDFIEESKKSGLIAELIKRHNVGALSVPPATT